MKIHFASSALVWVLCCSAQADIINVPADHLTIQAAIEAAVNGDEIIVAPGTYLETIDFLGKAITVRSTDPTDIGVVLNTIIDGTGFDHVVQCITNEGPDTVLSGFVITGGNAKPQGGVPFSGYGGGMYNLTGSPTVTNCSFNGNTATNSGGGMFNLSSSPTVTNCSFNGNTANSGGGMSGGSPTVTNCSFTGNTANSGGGMSGGSPTVTNCTFSGNTATNIGGGMLNTHISFVTVTNCSFSGNTSNGGGGGMYNNTSNITVSNCSFSGNTSITGNGGGMFNLRSSPTVSNCSFSGNTAITVNGGGMYNVLDSSPKVTDCLFSVNSATKGGGMYNDNSSRPTVSNSSFSGNTATEVGGGIFNVNIFDGDRTSLTNTGFCNNMPNQISGFYTDCGGNSLLYCPPPIPMPTSCPEDITGDGNVNVTELLMLLAAWGPNVCSNPADFNGDGTVNVTDLLTLLAAWGVCP